MLRRHLTLEPCLPRPTKEPPAGPGWIHEIKHDGFRILARRDAKGVRLFTRNGYDFTTRFPKIIDAVASLPVRSCVVDGEAIVVDERGLSVFDALRYRLGDHPAVLCAFDLIELDGEDTRGERLENRKRALADLLRGTDDGIAFNKHRRDRLPARMLPRVRRDRVETTWFGLSLRPRYWLKIKNAARLARGERCTDRGLVIGDDVAPLPAAMGYRRVQPQLFHRPRQQRAGMGLRVFRDGARKTHRRQTAYAR